MTMSTSSSLTYAHILIIGGGVTGLLLAHGLKQAGIRTTVFEKEPSGFQSKREWTVAIHWSAPHLKTLLPPYLYARLWEAYCDPFYPYDQPTEKTSIYNSQTGELMKEIEMPGMIRVDRNRFRKLCSSDIDIQYSKTLSGIVYGQDGQGVTASFEDGTEVKGDLVIGADGPSSTMRTHLLGKEAERSSMDLTLFMTTVRYGDAEKARLVRSGNPVFYVAYNPAGIMTFISIQNVIDPADPTTWTFTIACSWADQLESNLDNKERLEVLKKKVAENCGTPFREAVEWIPDLEMTKMNGVHYWVTKPWDNHGGRVTLAGDAAHPMTPYRGQGLNHCIADVASLVKGLSEMKDKNELADVVAKYEAEMIPRGKAEVESSVENAAMLHDWDRILKSPMMKHGALKTS